MVTEIVETAPRPMAADDYEAIRAHVNELRRERRWDAEGYRFVESGCNGACAA
jgi:hypothetical protein